jgi:small neutral amino acid transporter SnatA (MarC family)
MRFWTREAAGWALVVIGLVTFIASYLFLISLYYIEAFLLIPVGIFIFRGGIHLLKVAVAARVCMDAAEKKPREPLTTSRSRA